MCAWKCSSNSHQMEFSITMPFLAQLHVDAFLQKRNVNETLPQIFAVKCLPFSIHFVIKLQAQLHFLMKFWRRAWCRWPNLLLSFPRQKFNVCWWFFLTFKLAGKVLRVWKLQTNFRSIISHKLMFSTSFPHINTLFSIGLLITFENFPPQIHSCAKMKFSLSQINIEIISRIANCEEVNWGKPINFLSSSSLSFLKPQQQSEWKEGLKGWNSSSSSGEWCVRQQQLLLPQYE